MVTMDAALAGMSLKTLILITLWSIPWKAWALWLAARRGDIWWFLAILILNTVGILECFYIFLIAKRDDGRATDTPDTSA